MDEARIRRWHLPAGDRHAARPRAATPRHRPRDGSWLARLRRNGTRSTPLSLSGALHLRHRWDTVEGKTADKRCLACATSAWSGDLLVLALRLPSTIATIVGERVPS